MIFQVDFQAGKPVYLQLADQIRFAAASGRLRPGDPLPSLRPLAEELRINRNTIAKAYAELEAQGIIETLPGKGCFLKSNQSVLTQQTRQRLLLTEIDEAVVMAHHLRVDREKFLALVRERLDFFESKASEEKGQPMNMNPPESSSRTGCRAKFVTFSVGRRCSAAQEFRAERQSLPYHEGEEFCPALSQPMPGEGEKANPNAMKTEPPVIEIKNLSRRYGRLEAVNGLNITVQPGRCYGFFGRNGAGKTTTIKCLLNLLQPTSGTARVFGLDPHRQEVAVKSRLSYVPDSVAFYPWMTVDETLRFIAAFRPRWNREMEADLLGLFRLDRHQKTSHLSKGQKTQLALIGAVCPEPELLVLDEPTSGLDPIVRREFIQTVIGAYHAADPEHRTVFVSTHLICEFEGLIDEFTIIEQGRELLTLPADQARERFQKIRATFLQPPAGLDLAGALQVRQSGLDWEILADGNREHLLEKLRACHPEELRCDSLSLEEIFVAAGNLAAAKP